MTKQHQIVGYDPVSELPTFSSPIPNGELDRIHFEFDPDDPEGSCTYKLEYSKVADLLGSEPPRKLEYFIEPYP
jgi:hypothetical protein